VGKEDSEFESAARKRNVVRTSQAVGLRTEIEGCLRICLGWGDIGTKMTDARDRIVERCNLDE
jgi:hypothetical protein